MSALEIMQACLYYFKNNSEKQENTEKAELYLSKIARVVNGENVTLSNCDFLELHEFVITIYSGILEKGKVAKGDWTDKQWENVLENIEGVTNVKSPKLTRLEG